MSLLNNLRFSLSAAMMFVLMAACSAALFVEVLPNAPAAPDMTTTISRYDVPTVVLLGAYLTGAALGAWKDHTPVQVMLQITLACLGMLSIVWLSKGGYVRGQLYWLQTMFAITVALPLVARSQVKKTMERGPRRNWWKKNCEAVFFSFLNVVLVGIGAIIEWFVIEALESMLQRVA